MNFQIKLANDINHLTFKNIYTIPMLSFICPFVLMSFGFEISCLLQPLQHCKVMNLKWADFAYWGVALGGSITNGLPGLFFYIEHVKFQDVTLML